MSKRLLLFFSSLLVVFVSSIAVDRLSGWLLGPHKQGLIFPRNVTRHFQTPEFSFTTTTNSLGFRDREFSQNKKVKTRIVALGDSFTYGWGVAAEESWPKALEQRLRSLGLDVEVANLGKPGASPRDYADIAEQSLPLLQPDVVIVGVLQGDDLAQMEAPPPLISALVQRPGKPNGISRRDRLRRLAGWLYPNFLRVVDDQAGASAAALTSEWQQQAQLLTTAFTTEEKARLDKLDPQVKDAFRLGELNPSLIYLGIHSPDYFLQTMDFNSAETQNQISNMSEQLVRIRIAASQINAKVIVVSVPYGIYVSPASRASRQRLGFAVTPEMLTTNPEDEAIGNASQRAGLDFYEFTDQFRKASTQQQFFYELDGHFNRAGHAFFAEALTTVVSKTLARPNN
jgi:lysophospholipase L1-like esterase